jgi:hypothetical protein
MGKDTQQPGVHLGPGLNICKYMQTDSIIFSSSSTWKSFHPSVKFKKVPASCSPPAHPLLFVLASYSLSAHFMSTLYSPPAYLLLTFCPTPDHLLLTLCSHLVHPLLISVYLLTSCSPTAASYALIFILSSPCSPSAHLCSAYLYILFTFCQFHIHLPFTSCSSPGRPGSFPPQLLLTSCSSSAHHSPLLNSYSPPTHIMLTSCPPSAHFIFTSCSSRANLIFTSRLPLAHRPLTSCLSPAQILITSCSALVYLLFMLCTPTAHLLLNYRFLLSSCQLHQA